MVTPKHTAKMPPASGSGNATAATPATRTVPKTPAAPTMPATPAAVAPGRLLRVTHDTEYRYAARVESAQHQARLQPLATLRQQVLSFAKITSDAGIVTTVRKTRGDDIDAACGQLAGDVRDRTRVEERMARQRATTLKPVRVVRPAAGRDAAKETRES